MLLNDRVAYCQEDADCMVKVKKTLWLYDTLTNDGAAYQQDVDRAKPREFVTDGSWAGGKQSSNQADTL